MTITGESTRRLPLIGRRDLETTVRTLEEITRLARETTKTEGNR